MDQKYHPTYEPPKDRPSTAPEGDPPRTIGRLLVAHQEQLNQLLAAVEGLEKRLEPMLLNSPGAPREDNPPLKHPHSILFGELEALMRTVQETTQRINSIYHRLDL